MTRTAQERRRESGEGDGGRAQDGQQQHARSAEGSGRSSPGESRRGMFSELRGVASGAALEVLAPVAERAAKNAAKTAVNNRGCKTAHNSPIAVCL